MKKNYIPIHRVIEGIIALLGDKAEFTVDDEKIQESFFKLSNKSKYKELLAGLKFSENTIYHKSLILESIFDNLSIARLITTKNPDLEKYQVTSNLHDIYVNKSDELFEEKKSTIEEASDEFRELVEADC